jgi:hypothetical protein
MEVIVAEIKKIIQDVKNTLGKDITEEYAFNYLTLWYFFVSQHNNTELPNYLELSSMVVDGANDGGVDYVFYDEEKQKIILAQSKFTKDIDYRTIITELRSMVNTFKNFIEHKSEHYNPELRRELREAIDRLPDDSVKDVEYIVFTMSDIDESTLLTKIDKMENSEDLNGDVISVYNLSDIEIKIENAKCDTTTICEGKIKIDKAKNVLSYETSDIRGIMVNVSSNSIKDLYDLYSKHGLFDLNIRQYIRSKVIDTGIEKTLEGDRENFWAYNNGLIFACSDFDVSGNVVKLWDFSIVNGGQTTHLLGTYKSKNNIEFYLPCKIICQTAKGDKKSDHISSNEFYNKIAETTNSQKPISPRDLKSNSREMLLLRDWLKEAKIALEIKRGKRIEKKNYDIVIKNEVLGQLIISFIEQKPGTARSNKAKLFENSSLYNRVFKNPYHKDQKKKACIIDLIKLNKRFDDIKVKLLKDVPFDPDEMSVFNNGKYTIVACIGLFYAILNGDTNPRDLINEPKKLSEYEFVYEKIIDNYKGDDINQKLEKLIILIVEHITKLYIAARDQKQATSVSNYFKSDKTYSERIVPELCKQYVRYIEETISDYGRILLRNQ